MVCLARLGRRFHQVGLLTLALSVLSICSTSFAQVSASLSGTMVDQPGAAVSAATVVAINVDTGISRSATSDRNGQYHLFALPVGVYEIRVTKEGFAEEIRSGSSPGDRTRSESR